MNKFELEQKFAERMKRCYPPFTRLLLLSMDGDASADLITVKNTVKTHRQLKNQYFTMRLPRLLRKRLRWKKPMLLVSAGI